MRITTIIVATLIAASLPTADLHAQPLSEARPPAEFPPASYRGLQYVDSKGCVYIRAGIDGDVTWVPRVTRQRQQVCGFRPTLSPAQRQAAAVPTPAPRITDAPEEITLTPSANPSPPAVAPSQPAPRPNVVTAPEPAPKPVATTKQPQAPTLPETTRILRRHVADARAASRNIRVPRGYERAWSDDRLNPRRSEMTLKPSRLSTTLTVPRGYRRAWDDGRLNPRRASQSAAGQAATNSIWTQEVPRQLVRRLGRDQDLRHEDPAIRRNSPFWQPPPATAAPVTRVSTRSATTALEKPVFIRVAHYKQTADAKQTARALNQRGLPVRMGKLQRAGQVYPLVLAGPFASDQAVNAALSRLRAIGFASASVLHQ